MVRTKMLPILAGLIMFSAIVVSAQQNSANTTEQRMPLTQATVALDAKGTPALEATLRTTAINGAPDAPVANIRIVLKNVSPVFLTYVSGLVTFYDGSGVRCGEGVFTVDALAQTESAETDSPGLRVTCAPATWRIVATNLLPRAADQITLSTTSTAAAPSNLVISIDGEEHPLQLGKPMVVRLGEKQRTITVRSVP
jgi:hypothetical protein